MPITHYAANIDLDARYGSGSPASVWFALFTSMPGLDATGGAEPTDSGYARVELTNNDTNFPDASLGVKQVATAVTFASAVEGYTLVGIGIYDAATSGNLMHYQQLDANEAIAIGVSPNFPSGQIQIIR
jgi:hypothetical protein